MTTADTTKLDRLIAATLVAGTLLVYGQVVRFDFSTYDDPVYVAENPAVQRGLAAETLVWAFTTGHGGNWHPLTWLSHALDWQLFGAWAGGHHLTSVALHALNSLLLYGLLRRLTGAAWRSAVVAALFAWHPLHVESVAWVSERKDVLSALFGLLALRGYGRYVERRQPRHYWWALLWFGLGLMAKPMVITLPFVMLLLDFWPLGRLAGSAEGAHIGPPGLPNRWREAAWRRPVIRLLAEKWPFLLLAAVSAVATLAAQQSGGAVITLEEIPLGQRLANAVVAQVRYLQKTFWPAGLVAFYPMPPSWGLAAVGGAGAVLAAVTLVAVRARQRQPWLLVGWLWFVGMLVPVIGLVQVGLQSMADRYTYLPLVGVFIGLVWAIGEVTARRAAVVQTSVRVATGLVLAGCLALTWRQVGVWRDGVTLFTHALEAGPDRFVGHNNLARALGHLGRMDEAEAHFRAALALRPGAPLPLYNLGLIAARRGNLQEALARYEEALQTDPAYTPARLERANVLANLGRLTEAVAEYRQCLRQAPGVPDIHRNLGIVLGQLGDRQGAVGAFRAGLRAAPKNAELHHELARALEALGEIGEARLHYAEAVRLRPDLLHARLKLGLLQARTGRFDAAREQLLVALRLSPTNTVAHYNLGAISEVEGRIEPAIMHFSEVVRLNPGDLDARGRLAALLARAGQTAAAVAQYQEGLRAQPDWVDGLRGLAWLLATSADSAVRNGAEAVRLATRAAGLTTNRHPAVLAALDAAYAETGQFDQAIRAAEDARQAALEAGLSDLARAAERRIEAYRAGRPFRE